MKTIILFLALCSTANAQYLFRPFIAGAGHPSSPQYRHYYRNYRPYYRPYRRSYAPTYAPPLSSFDAQWMAWDIQDIATAARSHH